MKLKVSRKVIVRSLIGVVLIWAFVLPFVFEKKSDEKLSDISQSQPIKSNAVQPAAPVEAQLEEVSRGSFRSINGQTGSGDVLLLKQGDKYFIRLESNFSVSRGPDLLVAVGQDGKVLKLVAGLKGTSGGQNYELPADIDPASFNQVLIHCRAFQYSFAVADLVK